MKTAAKLRYALFELWWFLISPIAPVILFVLMLIVSSILHNLGAYTLDAVCNVVFTAGMVLSFLLNFNEYGTTSRWILIVLCLFCVFSAVTDVQRLDNEPSPTGQVHSGISFTGSHRCTGCGGDGYIACNAANCSGGYCTACNGGIYTNGSSRSVCRVCGGDSLCNRCSGTNMVRCNVCH